MIWFFVMVNNIVFQTVITGVLIYIFSEIIRNYILIPIQNYSNVVGKIDNKLKFYSNITANPGCEYVPRELVIECSKIIRELSCELESCFKQLPFQYFRKKQKVDISESAKRLIKLSNNLWSVDNKSKQSSGLRNVGDEQVIRMNLKIENI